MKCPECVKLGKSSKFYENGGARQTLLGGPNPYWDENNIRHFHDSNTYTQHFYCSEGHWLYRKSVPKCCDEYPGKEEWFFDDK